MVKEEYHKHPKVRLALFFLLIAVMIDHNINITIFVYVLAQQFKKNFFFSFEIAWRVDVFAGKYKQYPKHLTKLGGSKVLSSRPHTVMPVVSFTNLISRVLSRDSLCDHLVLCTKVHITAHASHWNITILIHLKVEKCPHAVPQCLHLTKVKKLLEF